MKKKIYNEAQLNHTKEREKCFIYLTTHSTHFIYGYMASDIWLRTILIVRKETRCRHIGYSYRLTARVLLYMHHPTDRITHTTAFVTPVVEHWLEREIDLNGPKLAQTHEWRVDTCCCFVSRSARAVRVDWWVITDGRVHVFRDCGQPYWSARRQSSVSLSLSPNQCQCKPPLRQSSVAPTFVLFTNVDVYIYI